MKTIRWILVLVFSFLALGMVGCERDDEYEHHHRYRQYNYTYDWWEYYDNGYYQFHGSPNGPPLEGWPDNAGYYGENNNPPYTYVPIGQNQPVNYNNGGDNQPPAVVESELYVTLNNQSSVAITFAVNGEWRTVNPGMPSTWPYSGTAEVYAIKFGQETWINTWVDGENHTYVAHDNGIPGDFDLN